MLADMNLESIYLGSDLVGLEVQEAYYKFIVDAYFETHQKDIQALVQNTFKEHSKT